MWQKISMARVRFLGGLAAFLVALAGSAEAAPRLERERCTFKPPKGDRVECFVLTVLENREQPLTHVLSNSFGFGGTNCSLIFGRAVAA